MHPSRDIIIIIIILSSLIPTNFKALNVSTAFIQARTGPLLSVAPRP